MSKREENLKWYDEAVSQCPDFERKGKTMPYTSANGHMFSFLNKNGDLGIRLSKEEGEKFLEQYDSGPLISHGATMRGYVLIPDDMLADTETLCRYLKLGHQYVLTLKPK